MEVDSVVDVVSMETEVRSVLRGLNISDVESFEDSVRCMFRWGAVVVTKAELEAYKVFKSLRSYVSATSAFCDGYFEQAIEIHGHGPNSYRLFRENKVIQQFVTCDTQLVEDVAVVGIDRGLNGLVRLYFSAAAPKCAGDRRCPLAGNAA